MRRIMREPVGDTPRHVCRNFGVKYRRSDLAVFNVNQHLAKKLDPALKQSGLKEITYLPHFHAPKAKYPRRF